MSPFIIFGPGVLNICGNNLFLLKSIKIFSACEKFMSEFNLSNKALELILVLLLDSE